MPPKKKPQSAATELDAISIFTDGLRNRVKNPNVFGYKPHEKQLDFHRSLANQRLFIGGNRSGKTVGGCVEDVWWLLGNHPYKKIPDKQINGRIVAVDFLQGVEKIILPMIARWLPPSALINGSWEDSYQKIGHTLTLENGNTCEFLSYDQDLVKFAGTSRDFVHFDEEPPEEIFKECLMRTLDVNGRIWATLTPVDGMTWIYDALYLPGKNPDQSVIHVTEVETGDNPHISKEAIEVISASYTKDELEARLKGKFVQRAGLIYPNFNETNIISPVEPPPNCVIVASLDHGLSNATAWLWAFVDKAGNITVFDEYYLSGEVVSTHAQNVHSINLLHKRAPNYYVGDPSIRNREPLQGSSVHEEYSSLGIPIILGNNDTAAGYSRVKARISGLDNRKLYITSNCVNLIKEITRLHWATYNSKRIASNMNAKEIQHKKDDHAADSLRYLVMSRPEMQDDGTFVPPKPEYDYGIKEDIPVTGRIATMPEFTQKVYYDEHLGADF